MARYIGMLRQEAPEHNLIAASTLADLGRRHIADSAQLIRLARNASSWIDIGSGAGLPGVVIAILTGLPTTLVEPRRLRAEFLNRVKECLKLDAATVLQAKATSVGGKFDAITARAVAPLGKLLAMTIHLSHPDSVWVLPKGKSAKSELAEARLSWQCDATVEQSMTDPEASILVVRDVRAKGRA